MHVAGFEAAAGCGNGGFAHRGGPVRALSPVVKLIAGDLFGDESVVGFVVLERGDDVVAITPLAFARDGVGGVGVESDGIDISRTSSQ